MTKYILQFLYLGIILAAFLTGMFNYRFLKKRKLNILVPYLAYTFIQEVLMFFLPASAYPGNSNAFVYNIYQAITVAVISVLYYRFELMQKFRGLILIMLVLYLIAVIIVYGFIHSFLQPNTYLALLRGMVITVLALLFMVVYFQLDNPATEKHWMPALWITTGIVLFFPVISLSIAFRDYLMFSGVRVLGMRIYQIIPQVMSLFLYGCYCKAFLLCRMKK